MNEHANTGLVKTYLYCHNCDKNFVAKIDYDLDGQHIIECPYCAHEHCRVIKNGVVTGDRWDGRNDNTIRVNNRRVWKHDSLPITTSSASHFIRDKWLNHGEE